MPKNTNSVSRRNSLLYFNYWTCWLDSEKVTMFISNWNNSMSVIFLSKLPNLIIYLNFVLRRVFCSREGKSYNDHRLPDCRRKFRPFNDRPKGAHQRAIGKCHPSGWLQSHLFTEWFFHFIEPTRPNSESSILLILDGHFSHTRNLDVFINAKDNHVTILCLPPHSYHIPSAFEPNIHGSPKDSL